MAIASKKFQLKVHVRRRRSRERDVTIDGWSCIDANGSYSAPTTTITDCYFQDVNDPNRKYHSHMISVDDPCPGTWYATDFDTMPSGHDYNLVAVGDGANPEKDSIGPIHC